MSHRLNPSLNRIPRNLAALQSSSGYEGVAHPVLEIVNYSILHSSDRHISIPGKYRSVHLYFAGQLPLPPSLPPPQPIPQDYTDIIPSLQVDRADPRACFAHIDHQKLLPLCLSRCRGDNMNPERFAVAEHHNCSFPANLRESKRFEARRFREGKEVEEVPYSMEKSVEFSRTFNIVYSGGDV